MGLDLLAFREMVGQSQDHVALATGLTQPTISRIEAQIVRPSAESVFRINRWAKRIAREQRIPVARRLSWGWLLRRKGRAA